MLGCTAFVAFFAVGVNERQHKGVAAFAASSASIVALLGAAVATLYPYLIPSSSSAQGLSIFDELPNPEALAGMVPIVVVGLVIVYSYLVFVLRRLTSTGIDRKVDMHKAVSVDGA